MKKVFIDTRDAFKVFAIARYIFIFSIGLPTVVCANLYLEF